MRDPLRSVSGPSSPPTGCTIGVLPASTAPGREPGLRRGALRMFPIPLRPRRSCRSRSPSLPAPVCPFPRARRSSSGVRRAQAQPTAGSLHRIPRSVPRLPTRPSGTRRSFAHSPAKPRRSGGERECDSPTAPGPSDRSGVSSCRSGPLPSSPSRPQSRCIPRRA